MNAKKSLTFTDHELYCLWRALDLSIETGYHHFDAWDEDKRVPIADCPEDVKIWETMEKLRERLRRQ